jgi:thiol-disulfide isomerase/thioredoxin
LRPKFISCLGNLESKRTSKCILSKRQPLELTSANGSRWKLRLGSLGLGLLAPGLVFGVAVAVSEDLRLLYVVGAILLFCGATWVGAKSGGNWLSAFLLYVPLAGMFGFAVLRQLPFLWPHLLLWALAIALGLFLLAARLRGRAMIAGVVVLLAISVWYCMSYIPDQMKRAMNHFGDGAAPPFAFQAVSEGAVPTTATPGKILVIDFFGTWCPPCIAELPEIALVRAGLQDRRDIEFVVVATNSGGDTPERLRSFGRRQHITLPLAFDEGGKAHAAFGLSGFPGLVVIDRTRRVRLTREGYNSSETSFRTDLTQLLESL